MKTFRLDVTPTNKCLPTDEKYVNIIAIGLDKGVFRTLPNI